jgi:biopolymer transport protein ExbB/biopolymer transport protein TolQ
MLIMHKLVLVAHSGAAAVLYILLALSVYSVGVVLERWWYFRKRKLDMATTDELLTKRLRDGDVLGAKKALKDMRAVEAEVLHDALEYYADGPESFQEIVQKSIRQRRKVFESGLLFLGTLGSNSPFVGLFGTVLGVVAAFKDLGAASAATAAASGSGGMGNVMSGIAEALIATAVGILVAIPAVIAYNLFQKKCNDIEENSGALANQVLAIMKSVKLHKNTHKTSNAPALDEQLASTKALRQAEVNG